MGGLRLRVLGSGEAPAGLKAVHNETVHSPLAAAAWPLPAEPPAGVTTALFLTRLAQRFLIPGLAQLTGPPAGTELRQADRAYNAAITRLARQASLAA
jgi:hypothetical protein